MCIKILVSNAIQLESIRGCQLLWGWGQRYAHLFLAHCCICCSSMYPGPPSREGEDMVSTHTLNCTPTVTAMAQLIIKLTQAENSAFTGIYINRNGTDVLVLFLFFSWSGLKSTLTNMHPHPHSSTPTPTSPYSSSWCLDLLSYLLACPS